MPAFAVTRRRRPAPSRRPRTHPKMSIVSESGTVITVPYAPRETSLDGVAPTFSQVERPGREPLLLRSGDSLRQLSFDLTFGHPDPQASIETQLQELRALARSGQRLRIVLDHTTTSNLWRMTSFSQQVTSRQHGTNHPTRATVAVSFTRAVDPVVAVGPLTGGAKPAPKPPPKSTGAQKAAPRVHVVARGDTLSAIALKFYGNARLYPKIADANKIRNANLIRPGQKLTIP